MAKFVNLPNLEIQSVTIKLDEGEITRIKLEGNQDIFNHEKVKAELNNGGKIIAISGFLKYKDHPFDFSVGHNLGSIGPVMTHIRVAKKGESEKTDLATELYRILYEIYEKEFFTT